MRSVALQSLRRAALAGLGIAASFLALVSAASVGHPIALMLGIPKEWFDVDFNHPYAMTVAFFLQLAALLLVFVILGRLGAIPRGEAWLASNPVTLSAGFLLFRIIQPFTPELAYSGGPSFLLPMVAFPLLYWASRPGRD